MTTRYVGRTTWQKGKKLLDLLSQLKNFGEGRVVYRNTYNRGFPEVSYYVIRDVKPDMSDLGWKKEKSHHILLGLRVFRGENQGVVHIGSGYKSDWHLVPKDEERAWLDVPLTERPKNVVPRFVDMPPLLEHFVVQDMLKAGKPATEKPRLELEVVGNGVIFDDEVEHMEDVKLNEERSKSYYTEHK